MEKNVYKSIIVKPVKHHIQAIQSKTEWSLKGICNITTVIFYAQIKRQNENVNQRLFLCCRFFFSNVRETDKL